MPPTVPAASNTSASESFIRSQDDVLRLGPALSHAPADV
jgi:hypothetical protein